MKPEKRKKIINRIKPELKNASGNLFYQYGYPPDEEVTAVCEELVVMYKKNHGYKYDTIIHVKYQL
jgi:hypothetical protein